MLDKVEPPPIPDGFGISVAYACLLDIVRSISLAILGPSKVKLTFTLVEYYFNFVNINFFTETFSLEKRSQRHTKTT